jgi:hypothetical protein
MDGTRNKQEKKRPDADVGNDYGSGAEEENDEEDDEQEQEVWKVRNKQII